MKRVLVIGATGLLGKAITSKFGSDIDVIQASRNSSEYAVDLANPQSLQALFDNVGIVDAIVCTAGVAEFKPFAQTQDSDWQFGIENKMMGQINVIRYGEKYLTQEGSIVLTTGVLAQSPMPGSAIVSAVNAAVEGAIRALSLELEHIRINAISPGWISETLTTLGMDASQGIPASDVAQYYIDAINTSNSGDIIVAG